MKSVSISHWIIALHHAQNTTRHCLLHYQNVQFSANLTEKHLQKALYIVHYLSSTMDLCICYSGLGDRNGFIAYSDMDWNDDIETSQSTTGYAMFLANGIISWLSRRQKRVHLSSTKAEYVGMTETAHQIQWIRNLYEEIGFILGPLPLYVDNQGTIFLASNPAQEGHTNMSRCLNTTFVKQ